MCLHFTQVIRHPLFSGLKCIKMFKKPPGEFAYGQWKGTKMPNPSVKEQAHQLLDDLPDSTTWEDLMYRIYVRQSIEKGLHESDIGETVDVEEVRNKFGLSAWRSVGQLALLRVSPPYMPTYLWTHQYMLGEWWIKLQDAQSKLVTILFQAVECPNMTTRISARSSKGLIASYTE